MDCGYGEKLILYFYGEADPGLRAGVEAHLSACPVCRAELSALAGAGARLSAVREEPCPEILETVMRAARAAARYRAPSFAFAWREMVMCGALASLMTVVFAFSGRGAAVDLAWNSRLNSRLDSVEYSMYQVQSDMSSVSGDWEYHYGALEDESLLEG